MLLDIGAIVGFYALWNVNGRLLMSRRRRLERG
jgi:hypothetical protein